MFEAESYTNHIGQTLKRAYKVDLSNQHVKETVDFIQKII
mgnify:CR=1 FL=1